MYTSEGISSSLYNLPSPLVHDPKRTPYFLEWFLNQNERNKAWPECLVYLKCDLIVCIFQFPEGCPCWSLGQERNFLCTRLGAARLSLSVHHGDTSSDVGPQDSLGARVQHHNLNPGLRPALYHHCQRIAAPGWDSKCWLLYWFEVTED